MGYTAADWVNFALAITAATATLAGLLFVAMSINLQQMEIMRCTAAPGVPGSVVSRASAAMSRADRCARAPSGRRG